MDLIRLLIGFIALLIISTSSIAGWFDGKLTLYSCKSMADANACDTSCINDDMKVEIKVDKKDKKILATYFEGGQQQGSIIYETSQPYTECSIFDDKNWKCSTSIPPIRGISGYYSTTTSMTNGRYYQDYPFEKPPKYRCAK